MRTPRSRNERAASSVATRGKSSEVKSARIFFGRKATWRNERDTGGDNQGAVRAGERGAESLDGVPICLADFLEFREVVDETGVNHAIRHGCSAAQAFQVFKITSMHLGASGGKRLGGRI